MIFKVEIVSESGSRREWQFRSGQRATFGRSTAADVHVENDQYLSSVHFRIDFLADSCVLRDLNSSNGTRIDGTRIENAPLADGATFVAGRTPFRVEFQPEGKAAPDDRQSATARLMSTPTAMLGAFRMVRQPSGVCCYEGFGGPTIEELIQFAAKQSPAFLLIDFAKASMPVPESAPIDGFVFNWMPPAVCRRVSPKLKATAESKTWPKIVEHAWGKGALVCLFSHLDEAALLAHIREVVRGKKSESDPIPQDQMVGFCWPGTIGPLLEHSAEPYSSFLMKGIDAILIEAPPPFKWRAFSGGGFRDVLLDLKLEEDDEIPQS